MDEVTVVCEIGELVVQKTEETFQKAKQRAAKSMLDTIETVLGSQRDIIKMISCEGVKRRHSQAFEEDEQNTKIAELKRQLEAKDLELEEWETLLKMKKNKLEEAEKKNLILEQQCKDAIKLLEVEKEKHNNKEIKIKSSEGRIKSLEAEKAELSTKYKKYKDMAVKFDKERKLFAKNLTFQIKNC